MAGATGHDGPGSAGGGVSDRDHRALASSLAPLLVEACAGRLDDIAWFKADWQRSGAATATAHWRGEDDRPLRTVVKLPVSGRELRWIRRLQPAPTGSIEDPDLVVPRLLASGETIGGYDLSWMVIECFEHGPLGMHWTEDTVPRIVEAATRFHAACSEFEIDRPARTEEWPELVDRARSSVKTNHIGHAQLWNETLKKLAGRLDGLVAEWRARPIDHWIHGDLHLANAMSRHGLDVGRVSLIDLAEVRPGHWVEDAVFLERQFWANPDRLRSGKPVPLMRKARKALGLPTRPEDSRLATIRRALLAASAPAYMKSEGHPVYLEACLRRLEAALKDL